MLTRRLASLLALVAVVGLAASGCGSSSSAIAVGDQSISESDFEASLDFVYENEGMRAFLFPDQDVTADQLRPEGTPRGAFSQEYAGVMGGIHFNLLLSQQLVADNDLSISAARRAITSELDEQLEGGTKGIPADLRDIYLDGFAALNVVQDQLEPDELNAQALDLVSGDGDVSVSSRYGSWDEDTFRIVPPAGPRPAPGTGGDAGTGAPGSELPAG